MSVRPVAFNSDGSVDVVFDEGGHTGTIPAADVQFVKNLDGVEDYRFILLVCPDGCGASSTHPIGGGGAPREVQEMFLRKLVPPDPQACPCGNLDAGKPVLLTLSHLKTHADQMDYTGRWLIKAGDITL
jgi:hypothetical protein